MKAYCNKIYIPFSSYYNFYFKAEYKKEKNNWPFIFCIINKYALFTYIPYLSRQKFVKKILGMYNSKYSKQQENMEEDDKGVKKYNSLKIIHS